MVGRCDPDHTYNDISRVLGAGRVAKPLIVEGVALLRVLQKIGRAPDFLVFVEKDKREDNLRDELESHFAIEQPENLHHCLEMVERRIRYANDAGSLSKTSARSMTLRHNANQLNIEPKTPSLKTSYFQWAKGASFDGGFPNHCTCANGG
jgi:hypothetical protein